MHAGLLSVEMAVAGVSPTLPLLFLVQPDILAMAHVHRLTPSPALIFTTIISLVVLIPGDFQSIVNYFR